MKATMKRISLWGFLLSCIVSASSAQTENADSNGASALSSDPNVFKMASPVSSEEFADLNGLNLRDPHSLALLKQRYHIDKMIDGLVPPNIINHASVADQNAFEQAVLDFIVMLYSSPLHNYNAEISVKVIPLNANQVQFNTYGVDSQNPSNRIPVSFIIQRKEEWQIIDLIVDKIDALQNIHSQINSMSQTMHNPSLNDLTQVIQQHNYHQSSTKKPNAFVPSDHRR